MKLLTLIFGCYLLTLSLLPCGDEGGCGDMLSAYTELSDIAHNDHNEDHNEQHTETCSPFCSCTCCGQITTIHVQSLLSFVPAIAVTEKVTFYKQSPPQDFAFGIWQPPKLG